MRKIFVAAVAAAALGACQQQGGGGGQGEVAEAQKELQKTQQEAGQSVREEAQKARDEIAQAQQDVNQAQQQQGSSQEPQPGQDQQAANTAMPATVMGTVTKAGSDELQLRGSDGVEHSLKLGDQAKITQNGQPMQPSDIKEGSTVRATYLDKGDEKQVQELQIGHGAGGGMGSGMKQDAEKAGQGIESGAKDMKNQAGQQMEESGQQMQR